MNLKLKLKKVYRIILDKVFQYQGGLVIVKEDQEYSTTHVIPNQNTIPLGAIIRVPLSEVMMSFRKNSWVFEYRVSEVDHQDRVVKATLIGLITIPLWKAPGKMPRHDMIYDNGTRTELVYYYGSPNRVPMRLKKLVRVQVLEYLQGYRGKGYELINSIVTGEFTTKLQKKLVESNSEYIPFLRGPSVLKHRLQD